MGAFDGELWALGYRFSTPQEPKGTRPPELVGPIYKGPCYGNCKHSACTACGWHWREQRKENS